MLTKNYSPLVSFLLWVLLASLTSAQSRGDFVFPEQNELAIGDPCTIEPAPNSRTPYAREGICKRVRDCASFIPRIIREPFDIRRDICYFEVHDPVVCCLDSHMSAELLRFTKKRLPIEDDLDDTNLIV